VRLPGKRPIGLVQGRARPSPVVVVHLGLNERGSPL
jgi:hypothetical protein